MTPSPRTGEASDPADPRPSPDPGARAAAPPLLAVEQLSKRFGTVVALDRVDLAFARGEVHALLGENGAGKSTLMHIVSGLQAPSAGTVVFDGKPVRWRSPEEARAAGITMVHQHFMLVPTMTVAENVALARGATGLLRPERLVAEVRALAREQRLDVGDPARKIEGLSVGEQQRVEILKALVAPVRLLVLDEPTAVLTPGEVAGLFDVLRSLAARGTAIVLVTHKLYEALAIADRVTVLRRGRVRGGGPAASFDERSLAALMVDDGPVATRHPRPSPDERSAQVRLAVEHLTVRAPSGLPLVDDVSFTVAAGEVLAIAGVEGNGQAELVRALSGTTGSRARSSGRVLLDGQTITGAASARRAGLAVIPADRRGDGLVRELQAWENLLLSIERLRRAAPRGWLSPARERERAGALLEQFGVRPCDPSLVADAFSGGNQQRLVLARELGEPAIRAVVAANPTRGLDIAATAAIHQRLLAIAARGVAVVVLATDLDEVTALGDRIGVLYRGRLSGPFARSISRAEIGRLMAGGGEHP